jgi:hypothetical protein
VLRIIGILGSLGLGLIMAAAGLALDVRTLFYSGISVFGLMVALWLYAWARPVRVEVPVHVAPPPPPAPPRPEPTDPKAKAIWTLENARQTAAIALRQGNGIQNEKAYNEVRAALLSIKREFGFGPLGLSGKGSVPFPSLLKVLIKYMDQLTPLLREDHLEEAQRVATTFGWRWQDAEEGLDATLRPDSPKT